MKSTYILIYLGMGESGFSTTISSINLRAVAIGAVGDRDASALGTAGRAGAGRDTAGGAGDLDGLVLN